MLKKFIYIFGILLTLIAFIAIVIYAYIMLDMKHVYVHHPKKGDAFEIVAYDFHMDKYSWVLQPDAIVDFKFKNPHQEGYDEAHIGWRLNSPLLLSKRDDGFNKTSEGIVFKGKSTDFCSLDLYLNENREIVKKDYKNNRFLWWCY